MDGITAEQERDITLAAFIGYIMVTKKCGKEEALLAAATLCTLTEDHFNTLSKKGNNDKASVIRQ
jgi:hypothetical protein